MFDALSDTLVSFAVSVIELFPASPFTVLDEIGNSEVYEWLRMVNWFVPVGTFVGILETWLAGVAIYYVYQIVLRWVKVIE
ncbi:hypothetical protein [uncultured Oscillibacter sp.]|uniref:hypothetical protein n=1 Tax=uncultured Oscillibacter sp. TaxID=876091 RepID=UPI0025EE596D|nr:hypothetical protein [uncultured Oscillibacter sp.]